ncbi:NAD-dependent dehydratase [Burkholderia sp. WAC0059]|uniref:UDP-glucose 4-epimerase family protein n=1 Tax=Burkholderia sp. WAC0059 TaxID=2066022 RepID=UPI000C7F6BDD|nr:SDR family oxidoreductase [Burkholderia sp. WAC0059]PLZ00572.1 NAD-dependent dehydratase [Burkholderia sp. WAC0059]
MSKILVTGANGFVGQALCRLLIARGHAVTALVRTPGGCVDGVVEWVDTSEDYARVADTWPATLRPDCIVHLAARVHVMRDNAVGPDAAFHRTNVDGTLRVARAALQHGVSRFVFASSIKAVADTDHGHPLNEQDTPQPQDAYGRSKLAAERSLWQLHATTGLDVTIVRPPLVYGPHVRANFLRMLDAVHRGLPLPLGAVTAQRSMVYIDNLADALSHCAIDPRAANQCFHVADDHSPTVSELLTAVGAALGRPARLIPVPAAWLRTLALIAGKTKQIDRLTGNLRVDTAHLRRQLDWRAPIAFADGLRETARWYSGRWQQPVPSR